MKTSAAGCRHRALVALMLGALVCLPACGVENAGSSADDVCAQARAHVSECLGQPLVGTDDACDAARAEEVLGLDCAEVQAAAAGGKADWTDILCAIFMVACPPSPTGGGSGGEGGGGEGGGSGGGGTGSGGSPTPAPATVTLSGIVYSQLTMQPMDGVLVKVTRNGQERLYWTTLGGQFVFVGLEPATYELSVLYDAFPVLSQTVDTSSQTYLTLYIPR